MFFLVELIVPLKIDDSPSRPTVKKVRFTANETGVHYLNVKFGSEFVPGNLNLVLLNLYLVNFFSKKNKRKNKGTPIKMTINDTRLVTAYGDGIHHALHEQSATFNIDTQDMQGDLKVRIEGKKTNNESIVSFKVLFLFFFVISRKVQTQLLRIHLNERIIIFLK